VTVQRADRQLVRWEALPGDTRWVDYAHDQVGDELVVYMHTFRRVRERLDKTHDLLLWRPSSTAVAHRYGPGECENVVRADREWPPAKVEHVPGRPRGVEEREKRSAVGSSAPPP
jgi:hypothetical protein